MQSPLYRNPTQDEIDRANRTFNDWADRNAQRAATEAVIEVLTGRTDPEMVIQFETTLCWANTLQEEVVDGTDAGLPVASIIAGFLMRVFWTGILLGIDMQRKDSEWAREFVGK